jgi:4-hydroxy-3-methylbut-2-enyl diphosphate reductase
VHVIYIGKRGHPEPAGVMGVAPDNTTLIESIEEADALEFPPGTRLAVTCQTTLSMWDTQAIIDHLAERFPEMEVHNEICRATQERQEAAVLAADNVDCVVVVGSRRSSNSRRLAQVVEELGHKPAFLVDSAAELRPEWFRGIRRVGVTSGASTPTLLTREVVAALEAMHDAEEITAPS